MYNVQNTNRGEVHYTLYTRHYTKKNSKKYKPQVKL